MPTEDDDRGDSFTPDPAEVAAAAEELELEAVLAATRDKTVADEAAEAAEVAGKATDDEAKAAKVAEDKAAADAKAAEDAEKAPKAKEPAIPLSRHKQILEQEREKRVAAESRLDAAAREGRRAQVTEDTAADEAKVDGLEEKYTKQLADGEAKEAAATMREIRQLERVISARQRDIEISAAEERAVERVNFNNTVALLEAAYPQIRPNDDKYSQDTVNEVLELQQAFVKNGSTPTAALQRAVKYVLKPATVAQEIATEEPPKDEADKPAGETAAARKAAAIAKAVDAAGKQPAKTAAIGLDSDKAGGQVNEKSVMKMSQDDFNKLGDEELARMRGDAL